MATEVGSLQASLSLDISNFAAGMQQAVSMVQQVGTLMKSALGNTQGFSSLQRQAAELRAEIEAIVSSINNLRASLNNSQNAVQIFTSIKQHTSDMSGDFSKISSALQQIISLLEQINNALSGATTNAQAMASQMASFTASAQNATRSARQTTTQTRQTNTATSKAAVQANRLSNQLKQSAGFAANLKNIIGGILISQSFYRLINIMQELVAGSYEFMNNMAQTEIAFRYLIGSAEGASSMIEALQDLSISSPISTANATEMSRKLMAMGFSAQSVIPTLQILTDASAVFTNSAGEMNDMMGHVVLALGQMKAAGKVSMQELRQLYNAGIPIFQLLQDGLGLTAAEVRNIGKLGIDSGTAILSILTQLQAKYSGAAEEMTRTIPGALEVIKDSLFVINNLLFAAPFDWFTNSLNVVADRLGAIVQIARVYGVGGIFQALFPREWHSSLRNIIGAFQQLGSALSYIGRSVGLVFRDAMSIILNMAGVVLPPISILIHALTQVAYWVIANIPLVRRLLAAIMAYAMITAIVKVLVSLARALQLVTIAHLAAQAVTNLITALKGLWAFSRVGFILMMVAGAFLAVALSSEKAKNAIQSFFGKIQNASKDFSDQLGIGFNPNDIAIPEFNPPETSDWGDYEAGLGDLADGYEDVADAADDATQAQKKNQSFLQSFDEVYTIKPSDDSDTSGTAADLADMNDQINDILSNLGDLSNTLDDFDWTGDFWTDWGNLSADIGSGFDTDALDIASMGQEFWEALVDAFSAPEWVGAGIGAIIGALLGSLIGHPFIGAAIGALVGWLAGLFWDDFKEAFNLSDYAPIVAGIAAGIAFILGKLLGFSKLKILASTVGLALGSMIISTILSKIAEACGLGEYTSDSIAIGQGIGTLIGAAIGLVLGHPILGAAIGNLAGGVVGLIWGALKEKLGVADWQGIATAISSALGAAFTSLAAGFWSITTEPLTSALTTAVTQGLTFSLRNGIKGGILGAISGLVGGLLTNALTGWIASELNMSEDDLNNSAIGQSIGGLIGSVVGLIVTGGNPIGAAIGNVVGQGLGGVIGLFANDIAQWLSTTWNNITEWCSNAAGAIGEFVSGLGPSISNWFSNLAYNIGHALGEASGVITQFVFDAGAAIRDFFTITLPNAWSNFAEGWTNFWTITFPEVLNSIGEFFTNLGPMFVTFFTETLPNAWNSFATNWTYFWTNTFPAVLGDIGEFFNGLWNNFLEWGGNIVQGFVEGFLGALGSVWDAIGQFFSGFIDGFCETFGIHSPADTTKPLGENVVLGFIEGITGAFELVWDILSNFTSTFLDVLGGAFTTLGTTVFDWATSAFTSISTWATNTGTTISNWVTGAINNITTWAANTGTNISNWANTAITTIGNWFTRTTTSISNWATTGINRIGNWATNTSNRIGNWASNTASRIGNWYTTTTSNIANWASTAVSSISSAVSSMRSSISSGFSSAASAISSWASSALSSVSNFCSGLVNSISSAVQSAISWLSSLWSAQSRTSSSSSTSSRRNRAISSGITVSENTSGRVIPTTGIVSDIPTTNILSKVSPMSGLVGSDTVGDGGVSGLVGTSRTITGTPEDSSSGFVSSERSTSFASQIGKEIVSSLAPLLATNTSTDETENRQPVYVGTLIADERGLKELERKLKVIRVKEDKSGR